jgi:hypothetical protein
MKPGRELDALIAEKVMGLTPLRQDVMGQTIFLDDVGCECFCACYSTQIADAWLVVEKMMPDGDGEIELEWDQFVWKCEFGWHGIEGRCKGCYAEAPTAPLAICLAALKAVDKEEVVKSPEK